MTEPCHLDGHDPLCHCTDEEWRTAVTSAVAKCKCGHLKLDHYTDRRHRPVCGSVACGCVEYRPREGKPMPARFDERYDPDPAAERWRP